MAELGRPSNQGRRRPFILPLIAVCVCVTAATADQHAFDLLWSDTETHLTTDIGTIAQTVWGYLCSGCQYSQPSAHHNQSYDPNIVFNLPSSEDETPFLNMMQHYENLVRGYYITPMLDDVPLGSASSPAANEVYAQIMAANFPYMTSDVSSLFSDYGGHTGLANIVGNGGAGFVYCGTEPLVSLGGGIGAGFTVTQINATAGVGGGAGVQAYQGGAPTDDDAPPATPFYNIGGGGGGGIIVNGQGTYNPTWGTDSDPSQAAPSGLWTTLAPAAKACFAAGNLTLVGGGGGGGGVIAMGEDAQSTVYMSYGGGWGFDFTYASPTGGGQAPAVPNTGNVIGQESEACRVQCLPNPFAFYACFCGCFKAAMVAMPGQAWAANMNCQMPP